MYIYTHEQSQNSPTKIKSNKKKSNKNKVNKDWPGKQRKTKITFTSEEKKKAYYVLNGNS